MWSRDAYLWDVYIICRWFWCHLVYFTEPQKLPVTVCLSLCEKGKTTSCLFLAWCASVVEHRIMLEERGVCQIWHIVDTCVKQLFCSHLLAVITMNSGLSTTWEQCRSQLFCCAATLMSVIQWMAIGHTPQIMLVIWTAYLLFFCRNVCHCWLSVFRSTLPSQLIKPFSTSVCPYIQFLPIWTKFGL